MAHVKKAGNPNWKPGQSGNPGGRPKCEGVVRELALAHSVEAMQTLIDLLKSSDEKIRKAAADSILDRGIGKPVSVLDLGDGNVMFSGVMVVPSKELGGRGAVKDS